MLATTPKLLGQELAEGFEDKYREIMSRLDNPGDNHELSLLKILDVIGLEACLLALGAVREEGIDERNRIARLLAADYAEHILDYLEDDSPGDPRPGLGIRAARKYAEGQIGARLPAAGFFNSDGPEKQWQFQRLREYLV